MFWQRGISITRAWLILFRQVQSESFPNFWSVIITVSFMFVLFMICTRRRWEKWGDVCKCWVLYAPVQILSPTLLTSHDHISSALPTGHSKNIREQKYFVKCRCINIWSKSGVFIMLRRTWHSLLIQIFFTTAQWSVLSRSCQVIREGGSLWHEHCWLETTLLCSDTTVLWSEWVTGHAPITLVMRHERVQHSCLTRLYML